jgi:hypothetical protein
MKKAIKAKWLNALRGGKYKQGQGDLKYDGGHCCLGVLTDLYVKERGLRRWPSDWAVLGELPEDVAKWAGLRSLDPKCGTKLLLSQHNDGKEADGSDGKPFTEIADLIERRL